MKFCDLTQFYSPHSGGVKRYLNQKSAFIREHRPGDSHLLIIPGEKDAFVEDGPCRVYSIKSPLISRTSRYRLLLRFSRVEEIICRERPNLIESGDPYQLAWKASATAEALGLGIVGFYHSHFPEAYVRSTMKFFGPTITEFVMDLTRRYVVALYNRFDRTIVPSEPLKQVLASWGVERLETTNLGVDPKMFYPDRNRGRAMRQHLGVPDETTLLLYVGRLAPEKNLERLLGAMKQLSATRPGCFRLLIVGEGTLRSSVRRCAEETGAVIHIAACTDAVELADYYRAADLFVHPGLQETFGLVNLESQACGTPVIGIRGSYMDRLIFTELAQWANEDSDEALANAIFGAAQEQPDGRGQIASVAVQNEFSWEIVFRRIFGIYEDVLRERQPFRS